MKPVFRCAHAAAQWMAAAGVMGLLVIAVVTAGDVALRYGFASNVPGLIDLYGVAGAACLAACMPYAMVSRGHITIRLLGDALGPASSRVLDAFGNLCSVGFMAVLAWQLWRFAAELQAAGEAMPILRWPIGPWWLAVAALITLGALAGVVCLFEPVAPDESPDQPLDSQLHQQPKNEGLAP